MTSRKEKAIQALLTSRTRQEAAQKAGIATSTLRGYFKSPEFVSAYRQAASDALQDAARKAQAATGEAVVTLETIMRNEDETAQVRISAADKILSHVAKLTETVDILDRLDALEAQADADND